MKEFYLDNSATSQIDEEALNEMVEIYKGIWGNPSSYHNIGFKAADKLQFYREQIAELLYIPSDCLFFTSGGTESNNWAIKSGAKLMREKNANKTYVLCSKAEHASVLKSCEDLKKEGFKIIYLDVNKSGTVDLKYLVDLINNWQLKDKIALACIMRVNNELGSIQNFYSSIADEIHNAGGLIFCDAVQAIGKIDFGGIYNYHADFVSFSAHKFHGPKGIGGLYVNETLLSDLSPLINGGGQQSEKRSGTEPLALIGGMYVALKNSIGFAENASSIKKSSILWHIAEQLKYYCNTKNKTKTNVIINNCSPDVGVLNISFKDIHGDMLQIALNDENIYVSTGSACHSGDLSPSHVLKAIGVPDDYIMGTIRISLPNDMSIFGSNECEVDFIVDKIIECLQRIERMTDSGININEI